ncbi:MAG TPA: lysylphosphatidylglycerol synthase transmembrane domain-containing protein [Terracidiphilus sp.]
MSKKQWILGLVVLAALIGLVLWGRGRLHFDFGHFWMQFTTADWRRMAIALGCIYAGYALRSARWALLLRHNQRVPLLSLTGTQVIGFTGVALIGRVADLVRPYLVAKKTGLPLSSQIAVYIVERLFDMGSMALILSIALVSVPEADLLKAIDRSAMLSYVVHHESRGFALFIFRYSGLILTLIGALFLAGVRWSGEVLASFCEHVLGLASKRAGRAVGAKIRAFRTGLDTMRSFGDFAATASLSLVMWGLITTSYLQIMHAFVASPPLATISFSKCVLLMVVSGGASVIQLPVLGWFSQIGIVAAVIAGFFGVPLEPATACAASLLLITFLGIVPVGLVWAQIDNVSLRKIAVQSEHAEELADNAVPGNVVN